MSKVYVVQEPLQMRNGRPGKRYSMKPAEEYGEIVILLDWSDTRDMTESGSADDVLWMIRSRMSEFNHKSDYVLLTGSWVAMSLAIYVAGEKGDGTVRCLQWDRDLASYRVITVDFYAPPSGLT